MVKHVTPSRFLKIFLRKAVLPVLFVMLCAPAFFVCADVVQEPDSAAEQFPATQDASGIAEGQETESGKKTTGFTESKELSESTESKELSESTESKEPTEPTEPIVEEDLTEDAEPPLVIDWEEQRRINPDIIGWLYVDGMSHISYPILYSGDNEYYLHRNYLREEVFAGSVFMESLNTPDFADPNTILYGHNMADGSMFGSLKFMDTQEAYDAHPHFWILTPRGDYRYRIFSMFFTEVDSDVYLIYTWHGPEFRDWEKRWLEKSDVYTGVPLTRQDRTVVLSTCTSDSTRRFVVFGKCVSSRKPVHIRTCADLW